jgi:hypothetical protein
VEGEEVRGTPPGKERDPVLAKAEAGSTEGLMKIVVRAVVKTGEYPK